MTKKERIQEEYGNDFSILQPNENGWSTKILMCQDIDYDKYEIYDVGYGMYMVRPKSLQGIENNNGWIKIESEDDLPDEIVGLWEVVIDGKLKFIELLKDNKERLYKDFLRDKITHYKIKEHSNLPIY